MFGALHPDEIEDVLHRNHVGRLACSRDDHPFVVPITYAYNDGAVYGVTLPGRKLGIMRAQPRVCFEVDELEDRAGTWRSVVAEGRFEEVTDAMARRAALDLLAGADPVVLADEASVAGVAYRLRLTTKAGRWVRRAVPGSEHPLLGVALRAGDVWNWPAAG